MSEIEIVRDLTDDQCPKYAAMLANSFEKDPLFIHICKKDFVPNLGKAFHKLLLNRHLMGLEVRTIGANGIAIIRKTPGKIIASVPLALSFLPYLISVVGIFKIFRLIKMELATINPNFSTPHNYLWYLAINNNEQGRGLGSTLVNAINSEFGTVFLQTSNPKNLKFYTSLGFSMEKEINLGKNAPKIWQFKFIAPQA